MQYRVGGREMFENVIKFFKKLVKKEQQEIGSKETAKERLHLVLMQDRANVSADFLELMKKEIIEVIKKYIDVEEEAIDVRLKNKVEEDGTTGAPFLYANIPVINVKNEAKKEKTNESKEEISKEKDTKEIKEESRNDKSEEKAEEGKIENNKKVKPEKENSEEAEKEEVEETKNEEKIEKLKDDSNETLGEKTNQDKEAKKQTEAKPKNSNSKTTNNTKKKK